VGSSTHAEPPRFVFSLDFLVKTVKTLKSSKLSCSWCPNVFGLLFVSLLHFEFWDLYPFFQAFFILSALFFDINRHTLPLYRAHILV
jgi:hypothetical protein